MPRQTMTIQFDLAERDTVLAALRLWQRTAHPRLPEWDIAADAGDPLNVVEIDTLAEKLQLQTFNETEA